MLTNLPAVAENGEFKKKTFNLPNVTFQGKHITQHKTPNTKHITHITHIT